MDLKIYQIDAFTDKLFSGNPAAVVPLSQWLPDQLLQSVALENNLSETAFFIPNNGGFDIRWFTPAVEVDLCGHATLAAAFVYFKYLSGGEEEICFQSRSGPLTVRKQEDWLSMDFPADTLQPVPVPEKLRESLPVELLECYRGRDDWMVVISSPEELTALRPDLRLLGELPGRGVIVTARGEDTDFVSRCFFPQAGIDEDPVTGSAHTTLTPYWASQLNKTDLTARQMSQRGGFLRCSLRGDRVVIEGQARLYLEGKISIRD